MLFLIKHIGYPNDKVRMFGTNVTNAEWNQTGLVPSWWTNADIKSFVWGDMTRQQINIERIQQAEPNVTIMSDITGFRMYEYWLNLMKNATNHSKSINIPIMMTEGGWVIHDRLDSFYPYPTADYMAKLNLKMLEFIQGTQNMTLYNQYGYNYSYSVQNELMALMPWLAGESVFDGADGM